MDLGSPFHPGPGPSASVSAMPQETWSPSLPQPCPTWSWDPLSQTPTRRLSSWSKLSPKCHYGPAWPPPDLILALTYGSALQLDFRPASSLWYVLMIQTLGWPCPPSLSLPCSPYLDAWLISSDNVSAVLIISPCHLRMKEVYIVFQDT